MTEQRPAGPAADIGTTRDRLPAPVFVGGSPRSGTHAMGRLLGAHPRYHLQRVEARFHSTRGGLTDLLAGKVTLERFLATCRGHWWRRGLPMDTGLQVIVERRQLERALEEFEAGFERDPWEAGRRLVGALLDPPAERAGRPAWVELTGPNIQSAPSLLRLFPRARFVHMVRDGRAVAAGILHKPEMTDDPLDALANWEKRIRAAHSAISSMPRQAVLTVQLEDLVALDRERAYGRLVEFLGLDHGGPMRCYFDERISPEGAHLGRWRARMPPPDARRVDRRYRRLVRELRRDGVDWVRSPEEGGLRVRRRARGRRAPG